MADYAERWTIQVQRIDRLTDTQTDRQTTDRQTGAHQGYTGDGPEFPHF
jgi:hypothetical protein